MTKYRFDIVYSELAAVPAVLEIPLNEKEFSELLEWQGDDGELLARSTHNDLVLPCQLSGFGLSGNLEGLERKYALFAAVNETSAPGSSTETFVLERRAAVDTGSKHKGVYLDHQPENTRVTVSIEGKLFTRYLYSADMMKPYYYPLIGPSGKTLAQDAPDDHLHHHGLWWGHDQVNGHQAYHEFANEGRQTHRRFLHLSSGPVFGQISACIDWLSNKGERLLQEVRTMRIFNLPQEERYVDVQSQLCAVDGEVVFGSTKEGGFPFIRVNEQICGFLTGTITASSGKKEEKEIFGTEADWVDYSGQILDVTWDAGIPDKQFIDAGIAMMVHPEYRAFSSKWFVRDSGAFTPSNFHFWGGHTLGAGDSLSFRQRIYLHLGDVTRGRVSERYREYANPAGISIRTGEE